MLDSLVCILLVIAIAWLENRSVSRPSVSNASFAVPPQPWLFITERSCRDFLIQANRYVGEAGWCNGTTDGGLCWPAAPPGQTISQLCPPEQNVDPRNSAQKTCDWDGTWAGQEVGPQGVTNYDACFSADSLQILTGFYGTSPEDAARAGAVLSRTRTIEMVGFPLSLTSVLISLIIFQYFRTLRCSRTTMHVHLFLAIAIMDACKIIEISDQFQSGYVDTGRTDGWSIRLLRPLCEILVVLIEYGRTAMFFWMFLEGFYMHNAVAWKVFDSDEPNFRFYCAIGWGIPALLITVWAPVIEFVWRSQLIVGTNGTYVDQCWNDHSSHSFYNILEIPRLLVIVINLVFLINIIRILLTKLRNSHHSDTEQIRKAIKATIVLAPLLGTTHLIWACGPIGNSFVLYAMYLYTSQSLRAFEGFFVALLYCFLNGEVHTAIRGALKRQASRREVSREADRRQSSFDFSPFLTSLTKVRHSTTLSTVAESPNSNGLHNTFQLFPVRNKETSRVSVYDTNGSGRSFS